VGGERVLLGAVLGPYTSGLTPDKVQPAAQRGLVLVQPFCLWLHVSQHVLKVHAFQHCCSCVDKAAASVCGMPLWHCAGGPAVSTALHKSSCVMGAYQGSHGCAPALAAEYQGRAVS
jgi:hypothetical protein